jgi:hypothetical protein
MSALNLLPDQPSWRSRVVSYYSGDWNAILSVIPTFELEPFRDGPDEPQNPFLQTVVRKPRSPVERRMPIGVVSTSYALARHDEVATLCRDALKSAGVNVEELRYEIGLSELGEWMNLRIYFPDRDAITDRYGRKLGLRLECFNSVDGSSRLVVLFGWLRFVCSNGLVIGETKVEIRERHGQSLDLSEISDRIHSAMTAVKADRERMKNWQEQPVAIGDVADWVNKHLSARWGKKAAARVYHICDAGKDVELTEPFAKGEATEKPVKFLDPVPGQPVKAQTKYDVVQAMSFVASRRHNAEERTEWQASISLLADALRVCKTRPRIAAIEERAPTLF